MTKILDCTLRDGGYYTNWDFDRVLVDKYIATINQLPIDYVEIGYRSPAKKNYLGEYFYTPFETIERIRIQLNSSIKIAIMFNTKDVASVLELEHLLLDCIGKIDMVRFAVSPANIHSAVLFAKKVKDLGLEVALNLMYLSQKDSKEIINEVNYILDHVPNIDFLYLVDSYGACLPSEVKDKFMNIREEHKDLAFGFHGHDNIQLAYANSLEAINAGVSIIDSTVTGMGRGAGNLCTEIICSYKAANKNIDIDYTNLVELVEKFNDLKAVYGWGASLPYMISGFNKLPQGEVMDLISLKRFSTNNIVKIIKNKIHNEIIRSANGEIQELSNITLNFDYDFSVLVGGGSSVPHHIDGLKILNEKFKVLFIHSTTKHLNLFLEKGFNNLVCLPGDEVRKIKSNISGSDFINFVISDDAEIDLQLLNSNYYRVGTSSIDSFLENKVIIKDAPLFMSLKVADILNISDFYIIGFDGYDKETQTTKILREENQTIIDNYTELNKKIISLTPTNYDVEVKSLYSLIVHGK